MEIYWFLLLVMYHSYSYLTVIYTNRPSLGVDYFQLVVQVQASIILLLQLSLGVSEAGCMCRLEDLHCSCSSWTGRTRSSQCSSRWVVVLFSLLHWKSPYALLYSYLLVKGKECILLLSIRTITASKRLKKTRWPSSTTSSRRGGGSSIIQKKSYTLLQPHLN